MNKIKENLPAFIVAITICGALFTALIFSRIPFDKKVDPYQKINYREKTPSEIYADITDVVMVNYFKTNNKSISEQLDKEGMRIEFLNSGLSMYIFILPTNQLHPYNRYTKGELSIDEVYEMSIGSIGVLKPVDDNSN